MPPSWTTRDSLRATLLERGIDRDIVAAGPAADPEALRVAYLDLLKLSLCDLVGAQTQSVNQLDDSRISAGGVYSEELPAEEMSLRAMGSDWPLSGLTMVGLKRLDDLQECIESVVADEVPGDVIEAGVWRGGASILARATLDTLGQSDRTVWVADSFQGLPPPDREAFPEDSHLDLSQLDYLSVPVDEVRGYFKRFGLDHGVEYVKGFFGDTLPELRGHPWSVIRLDGDSYEAIWAGLESLYPSLARGGYVVVDDYLLIREARNAVDEFREAHGITAPLKGIDWVGARWRREDDPDVNEPQAEIRRVERADPDGASERSERPHIPTRRELELELELQRLRGSAQ
ncbi:MAG: TylF/MycF family methyltransferase [Actinomycetota bacterium]|nr:TylF/MycF family methyltransferase [Actinomycetota bacterium]